MMYSCIFRSGVGRLVAACESPPVVLPIVHSGMERVMPRGATFPVPGQKVLLVLICLVTLGLHLPPRSLPIEGGAWC